MHCVDRIAGWSRLVLIAAALATACSSPPTPQPTEVPARDAPHVAADPAAAPAEAARVASAVATRAPLGAPLAMRSWLEVRRQAAERLVAAHPDGTYLGAPPLTLLAIPVLEVELNGDGSIRRILVLRQPRQALDTTQIAIDALHRAAPFGDVRRLPRPWKFVETFLFDEQRRFKPRSLD